MSTLKLINRISSDDTVYMTQASKIINVSIRLFKKYKKTHGAIIINILDEHVNYLRTTARRINTLNNSLVIKDVKKSIYEDQEKTLNKLEDMIKYMIVNNK